MYAEMLSVCIALSHNFTDKSLAILKNHKMNHQMVKRK